MHLTLSAPAKLNLFLAITGRRADGFHDLVSLVAPLTLADTLSVQLHDASEGETRFTLSCDDPAVPSDESNLVVRAARAFAEATKWTGGATFRLEKKIPSGAGLGGGSSDGVAALRALNRLTGDRLGPLELVQIAATLGSDCPLFLQEGPVTMRGRGETIAPLALGAASRLRGRSVLVFKPAFGVATAWAYRRMAELANAGVPDVYLSAAAAEQTLASWIGDAKAAPEALLFNNLERPAFAKHLALPVLLDRLSSEFRLAPRMTGSGSACFAFLPKTAPIEAIKAAIRSCWGESAFVAATEIA